MQQSHSSDANKSSASQEMIKIFMEPKGSLKHSYKPATCHYLQEQSSSNFHMKRSDNFFKGRYQNDTTGNSVVLMADDDQMKSSGSTAVNYETKRKGLRSTSFCDTRSIFFNIVSHLSSSQP